MTAIPMFFKVFDTTRQFGAAPIRTYQIQLDTVQEAEQAFEEARRVWCMNYVEGQCLDTVFRSEKTYRDDLETELNRWWLEEADDEG